MKRKQKDITSFLTNKIDGTSSSTTAKRRRTVEQLDPENSNIVNNNNNPDVQYYPQWMQQNIIPNHPDAFNDIFEKIEWQRVSYYKPQFGKQLTTPRYTTVYGCDDDDDDNSSKKRVYETEPIPSFLQPILDSMEQFTQSHFNMIMCNLYLNPENSISWHSDDEKFLGPDPIIASLTIGGSRDFFLREKSDHKNKIKYVLSHGDLLVMKGKTQHDWEHCVPKRSSSNSSAMQPRINLTFRKVMDYRGTNNYYKYTKYGDCKKREELTRYHFSKETNSISEV